MLARLRDMLTLPPEDEQSFSQGEKRARYAFDRLYRLCLGLFLSFLTRDFLFSPIWMHGYVWSLNLPIDLDMAEKSAGLIVRHQEDQVSFREKVLHMVHFTLLLFLLLSRCGFSSSSQRVASLASIAAASGLASGFVRTQQMRQRLFSALHEGMYTCVLVFVTGLALTLRLKNDPVHRFPDSDPAPVPAPEKTDATPAAAEADDSAEEEYEIVDKKNQ